jgi:hypothetical protein
LHKIVEIAKLLKVSKLYKVMKKKVKMFLGLTLVVVGLLVSLKSLSMTGNVIGNINNGISSIFGLILILAGMLVCASGPSKLEIKVWEDDEKKVILKGLSKISPEIVSTYSPISGEKRSWRINLEDLKELTNPDTISPEDKENLAKEYGPDIKKKITDNFKEYMQYKKNTTGMKIDKKKDRALRRGVAKKLRIAKGLERVYKILNPDYSSFQDRLKNIKVNEPINIYNPIRKGTATYVYFTSPSGIAKTRRFGRFKPGMQALYFSNLEKAEDFVDSMTQTRAKKLTGAKRTSKAVIFQTAYAPDKMNRLSGAYTRALPKGFFNDLNLDSIYTLRTANVPK